MKNNLYKYILLFILQYCVFTFTVYSQELDLSFGGGTGKVMIPIENEDQCNSVALQQDGKIVLSGYSYDASNNQGFSVVRLNSDGTIDNNFNSNGKKIFSLSSLNSEATAVKVDANGKIIVGGYTSLTTKHAYGIANLNTDGSFNTAFHTTGMDTLSIDSISHSNYLTSVDISSTRILLAGYSAGASYFEVSVAVLKTDGTIDNSFNTKGKLLIPSTSASYCYSAIFQKDGKILLAGTYNGSFLIIRLNTDGSFDTNFGTTGQVSIDFGTSQDAAFSIAQQKDGKIVAGGLANGQFALIRLNTDGSPDNTFGPDLNGKLSFNIGGISNQCNSIAIDTFATANKIIMAGYSFDGHVSSFATARLDLNGNIEAKSLIPIGSSSSTGQATSVVVQPDSKIVVAGYASNGTDDDFAVIRLLPDFLTTAITEPENTINVGVNIFPNPASYQLNIHSSYNISGIAIYNTLGEQVISVSNNNDVSSTIDISTLNKGIYTAVIITDRGNAVKKVVKQ